ncbi:AMP-binding protein [Novosphingobium malaysiense]|nr:AMP-binding protein [Novosphingobium malaysiense]
MNNPSLFQAFQASVRRHPELPAMRSGETQFTFAQLEAAATELAAGLMALGIVRGDRVAIWGVNSIPWALAGLALQAAGGALVPIGTRLRGREAAGILEDSGARFVFTDRAFGSFSFVEALLERAPASVERIVVLDEEGTPGPDDRVINLATLRELGRSVSREQVEERIAGGSGDDLADIIFTSGTTGKPKGVPMTQAQSLEACRMQQAEVSHFSPGEVFAVSYPFAHNAGYRAGWQIALLEGVCAIPVSMFDATEFMRLIEKEKVNYLPVVPTIAQAMIEHPDRDKFDLSSLRIIATGAATIPVSQVDDLRNLVGSGTTVATGYGLTESAGSVSTTFPDDASETVVKTVGRPLSNLQLKILDPEHNEVPTGERGEIAVKGPQVMKGYYNNPEATKAAFTQDGFLLTGDAGWLDEDGNLHIADRIKDMYLVGGFNCYPAEIENLMLSMDGISQVAVIGVDDERLGQVGRAFVVRSPGSTITEEDVIAWCRKEMANYKVPRSVRFLDALPVNNTGKIAKNELRAMAS